MGKIGIILAFLLSVAAAGGSYYLYQGWVEEHTVRNNVEAKYDQVKEKIITVQSEKEQIKAKSDEYRTKAEAMQSQLEKLRTEQKRIGSEKADLEKQLKDRQTMVAELQTKMTLLEKKAREAQAACGVTPADLMTDSQSLTDTATTEPSSPAAEGDGSPQLTFKPVDSGRSSVVSSEPAVTSTSSTVSSLPAGPETAVSTTAASTTSGTSGTTVTSSESSSKVGTTGGAKVLTVNRKFNFVVINQGSQEGLKMGDRLKVLKQGVEVATIQVEKLYDKFSAATLVEEDPKQQVVEGDEIRKA